MDRLTWTDRDGSGTMPCSNYIDRVLVKRVDLDLLDCPSLHNVLYSNLAISLKTPTELPVSEISEINSNQLNKENNNNKKKKNLIIDMLKLFL